MMQHDEQIWQQPQYRNDYRLEQTAQHIATLRTFIDQHSSDATLEHLVRALRTIESASHYWQRLAQRAFRLATGRDHDPDLWPAMSAALDAFEHWHAEAADIDTQLQRGNDDE